MTPESGFLGLCGVALAVLSSVPGTIDPGALDAGALDARSPERPVVTGRVQEADRGAPFLPIGIYLASPEEGGRVLTAVRLFPEGHPDALGHEYPTAFGFHRTEVDLLIRMGRLVGLELYATLMRHPAPPADEWEHGGFAPPAPGLLDAAEIEAGPPPVPGVRVVAYLDGEPLAFLVDTRGLSLEERGMERPTSSGLDIRRVEFIAALEAAGRELPAGAWFAVFDRPSP